MEEWQREYITTNLPTLISLTLCSRKLLAALLSRNVLAEFEAEDIETMKIKHDKAYKLYGIIQTKTDGYEHLIKSLHEANQTGALEVLLGVFPMQQVLESKVEFLGNVTRLQDLLSIDDLKIIYSKLKSEIKVADYIDLILKKKGTNEPIKLINDTIPSQIPYYIPRTLSKRTKIKKELFQQVCPDIFVFHGMTRPDLSELVTPNRSALSSTQIEEVTSRFILLKNYDDWIEIKQVSKHPVHLVRYEKEEFILEETSGGSKIINHFLERPTEGPIHFQENEFVGMSQDQGSDANGMCICDAPGIGKSVLLANLARNVQTQHPERIVGFIPLPDIQYMRKSFESIKSVQEPINVLQIVTNFITPSPMAREILVKLLERRSTRVDLFFDGFDEIAVGDLDWTKALLKGITQFLSNTKIYVTSRPHMRHELEETLGVISYDILPFNKANQIDFLVHFWNNLDSKCDASKLNEFAIYCLKKYQEITNEEERDLVGIPLICRLIGKVYAKRACRYSREDGKLTLEDACTLATSVYDIYKSYMTEAFGKQCRIKVVNFHILQAINLLFPKIANIFSEMLNVDEEEYKVLSEHFKLGILEQVYNGTCLSVKFIHRTFAEFLVAQFVGDMIARKNARKNSDDKLVHVLFQHICFTVKNGWLRSPYNLTDLYSFLNLEVVYFLNYHLNKKELKYNFNENALGTFSRIVSPQTMCKLLCSCARHDYLNIFNLIKELKEKRRRSRLYRLPNKLFKPSFLGQLELFYIFLAACKYASAQFLEKYAKFIKKVFSFDIKTFERFYKKDNYFTPLKIAVRRQNYDVLEFLANTLFVEGEGIIKHCVEMSHDDSIEGIEKRKEMIRLLLNKSKNIAKEVSWSYGSLQVRSYYCHVDLLKFMIEQGEDFCPEYNEDRIRLHQATSHLSPDEYHEFIVLMFQEGKAEDHFVMENRLGQRLLRVINYGQFLNRIRVDTLEMILDKLKIDVNAKNWIGNTFLISGVGYTHNTDIFDALVKRGVNIHATNEEGENVLHVAAFHANLVASKYFVSLGVDYKVKDNCARTPMDIAMNTYKIYNAKDKDALDIDKRTIKECQKVVDFFSKLFI